MTRLVIFLIESAPPRAVMYFATISSAVAEEADGGTLRAGASDPSTDGVFTGWEDPWWQE